MKSGEVQNNIVLDVEEWISEDGLINSSARLLPKGTVTMAMYGATASQVAYIACETTTNQACCNMVCNSLEEASYLYFAMKDRQSSIKILANGGAQENLSQELISGQNILIPNNTKIYYPYTILLNHITLVSKENHSLKMILNQITAKLS